MQERQQETTAATTTTTANATMSTNATSLLATSLSFSFLTCPEFSAHLGPGADKGGCNLTCLRLISNGLDDFYSIQSYAAIMSEFCKEIELAFYSRGRGKPL